MHRGNVKHTGGWYLDRVRLPLFNVNPMPRVRYIIGNWKMHGDTASLRAYLHQLESALWNTPPSVAVGVALPFPYLGCIAALRGVSTRVGLAAQDVSTHEKGAYTGEVSAAMLADIGVQYGLVGHSDRRQHHGETDAIIAEKAARLQACGIIPIVCIGETLAEYEAGKTQAVLAQQLNPLMGVLGKQAILAYEPVWAIGTGRTPTLGEIHTVATFLHTQLQEGLDHSPPLLYGGSVNAANAPEILATPGIDGALIGSASMQCDAMKTMIEQAASLAVKG